jgi:hypothetical protein
VSGLSYRRCTPVPVAPRAPLAALRESLRAAPPLRADVPGARSICELSSRYLPRISVPVPCMSQSPRLCRHQPPPRMHCWASLNIGLVGVGAGIVEAHPARSHTVTAIPIASRTMVHLQCG